MLNTYQQHGRTKLISTIVAVLVVAGIVVLADHLKANNTADTETLTTATSPSSSSGTGASGTTGSTGSSSSSSSSTSTSSGGYKDGTYTATEDYYVPHGEESIEVSLTLQGGVVTSASIQNSESDPDSASFQESFASAYKSYVVGKSISGLQLSVVGGASDTTQGFNDALSQIASKAQA